MNELAVSIGVILFPGLIASVICDKTAAHSTKWDAFKYGIYSFIFGVTCYAVVQVFAAVFALAPPIFLRMSFGDLSWPILHVWSIATAHKPDIALSEIVLATLMAPIVAGSATWISNGNLVNKLFQKLKISNKYGDENLFSHFLTDDQIICVYIRDLSTNQTYKGRVSSYSETDHIQEIVLKDVTVYEYETCNELYSLPSIYFSKPAGTFVIEAVPNKGAQKPDAETTP